MPGKWFCGDDADEDNKFLSEYAVPDIWLHAVSKRLRAYRKAFISSILRYKRLRVINIDDCVIQLTWHKLFYLSATAIFQ